MRANLLSHLRSPSPAGVIAVAALVLALTGAAIAAPKFNADKDEVSVLTATGSGVTTTPGAEDVIPLSIASFVQKAGEVVLLTAAADVQFSGTTESCDLHVTVLTGDPRGLGDDARLHIQDLWERGDLDHHHDDEILSAPASDTLRTLTAIASETDPPLGFGFDPCDELDEYTVSLRVSIVTLRN